MSETAPPIDQAPGDQRTENSPPAVTWRLATLKDSSALRVLHFPVEAASNQPTYLPDDQFQSGNVFAAESEGRIIGGFLFEEAVIVTFLGNDRRIAEFGRQVLGNILSEAKAQGKQLVRIQFPRAKSATFYLDRTGVKA